MQRAIIQFVNRAMKYSDILLAVAIIGSIAMMIIPMPAWLLAFLQVVNLAISLIIVLLAMYTREPLEFSIFPPLLLVTTLFRLSLNVSATRLILLSGEGGSVIQAFGQFVVGGNPVVGFIVFIILVIIQFVVITRGSERVAEVSARFTLDAMPGKQMAIDADLNSGSITEAEARKRRSDIQREADFYGAMDGASKFVRGDAIASIIIVVVNLVGGFVVGMLQQGMDAMTALATFSLLTVGDGLVTQIPALLISTAAGIVVTRASSTSTLGQDFAGQLFSEPRVLYIAAAVLALFALVPGLPLLPFLLLAGTATAAGYLLTQGQQQKAQDAQREATAAEVAASAEASRKPENVMGLLSVDPLEIELGYGLLGLADPGQGGDLMDRVGLIRRQIALDMGLVLPYIRVRDNIQLKPTQYVVKLRGIDLTQGEIYPDHFLAMNPGGAADDIPGIPTKEPAFGLPALWVAAQHKERAELAGYTVVEPAAVIATHLSELIKNNAPDLLGRQEVQALLDHIKGTNPVVVDELVPSLLTLGEVQKVLQNLLREGVSVRDLVTILEALADAARSTRDLEVLTEYVRQAMARAICRQFGLVGHGPVPAITLHPDLEQRLAAAVHRENGVTNLNLDPDVLRRFIERVQFWVSQAMDQGKDPVVLASAAVRPYVKRLTERALPRLLVLSFNELDPASELESLGMVTLE
ncbi:MAG: flagellar biosynthesis protein FlhA [Symbiobacteriia bacterium]